MVYVPVGELQEWKDNPRQNDEAAEKLCALIQEHGFVNPIIATRDGTIRAGHTRLKAAKKMGLEKVPVIFVDFDSEADAEMFAIADNRASEWAKWDKDLLSKIFSQLEEGAVVKKERIARASGFQEIELEGLSAVSDGYAAKSFSDIALEFEKGEPTAKKEQEHWLWVKFPTEEEKDAVIQKVGKTSRGGRELVANSLLVLLGLKKTDGKVKRV